MKKEQLLELDFDFDDCEFCEAKDVKVFYICLVSGNVSAICKDCMSKIKEIDGND